MWPFGKKQDTPAAKPAESSNSEFLEDPYADPFADDDEGASFGSLDVSSYSSPPPLEIISEAPPSPFTSSLPSSEAAATSASQVKMDYRTLMGTGSLSPAVQNAMMAATKQKSAKEAAYLRYNRRGVYERAMYNTGCAYLLGVVFGGMYGIAAGFARAPKGRMRIVLNSVLNAGGKTGAGFGNAAGVVTMFFSFLEGGLDELNYERWLQSVGVPSSAAQLATPVTAAALAGMTYRLPHAMSAGLGRGLAGLAMTAVLSTAAFGGLTYVAPIVSEHMPFSR